MNIGILYICTGKYDKFFDDFYVSSEAFFLPKSNKTYYIFTDSEYLPEKYKNDNVVFIHQKKLWWPLDTLMRFWMFDSIKDILQKEDFLVFFNANAKIIKMITEEEFLPQKWEKYIGALHWWIYHKPPFLFPYERRRKSTAYIPYYKSWTYFQWSLNWWYTQDYLHLVGYCLHNINIDLRKNFIARWHDESHLNKFFSWRGDIKTLWVEYNYPEDSNLKFDAKIILRNKGGGVWHIWMRS